jgi:hypothetical protein
MSQKENKKLTSVYIDKQILEDFKLESGKRKFSIQKLVERTMSLYINDDEFRKTVQKHKL